RECGNVDLPAEHRLPLLLGLDEAGTGIDLDLETDIRGRNLARDDLDHLVANVTLAAGKLVRSLQRDVRGGRGQCNGGRQQQATDSLSESATIHRVPPPDCGAGAREQPA